MGKSTHSSRNGAGGNFVTRCLQTAVTAGELGIECGELQAEGRWFGVDSMTAADGWCALEFMRPYTQRSQQTLNPLEHQIARPCHLHGKGGVKNV